GIRDDLVTGVQTCALPISLLPGVGALGVLSGRRRLWIPRSAPGCDGSHGSQPPGDARASAPGGGPAVRGGGRAALVAHALGSGQIGRASCREGGEVWVGGG